MTFSEETLMAYADNELDAPTRSAVEAAMASDPEVARRVAEHKALRGKLRVAFDKVLEEPTPQRLVDAARGVPSIRREGNVIPLRRKNQSRKTWPQWASIAASVAVGVLIGRAWLLHSGPASVPVTSRDGQLVANGVLARALSDQLASQTEPTPVSIGLTFKARSGEYCRTFTVHEPTSLAGLACREHDDWRVQVLAQTAAQPEGSATLRQAGSETPKLVLQAVEDNIAGDPLDAHAEAAARDKSWSP